MEEAHQRLDRPSHIRFILRHLRLLPSAYEAEESSRTTLAFFAIGALVILGALDRLDDDETADYIDWIYRRWNPLIGGFNGGSSLDLSDRNPDQPSIEQPHIVNTYTALLILALLTLPSTDRPKPQNPYLRLDLPKLLSFVSDCQRPDGSFAAYPTSTDQDVRFVYSALAILAMVRVDPRTVIDVDLTIRFVKSCRSYEGGYGRIPRSEAQGGTTYCAVASLELLNALESSLTEDEAQETTRWLVDRQTELTDDGSKTPLVEDSELVDRDSKESSTKATHVHHQDGPFLAPLVYKILRNLTSSKPPIPNPNPNPPPTKLVAGFQGRVGKPLDVCYSFWCSAALTIMTERLRRTHAGGPQPVDKPNQTSSPLVLFDPLANIESILRCQFKPWGGISRAYGGRSDLFHTYLALASSSISHSASSSLDVDRTERADPDRDFGLEELMEHDPLLNVPKKASEWIYQCFSPQ